MNKWTDEDLAAEINNGKFGALDELYSRDSQSIYANRKHKAHNPAAPDVEDLVQDIFIRVIKGASCFDPLKASFKTWIFRIARNCCIDFKRKDARVSFSSRFRNRRSMSSIENKTLNGDLPNSTQNTETSILEKDIHNAISDCISQMVNEEEREALLLYLFSGKVYREIS